MQNKKIVVVCDRGGHLHDALKLLEQMKLVPTLFVTTPGPDVDALRHDPRFQKSQMKQIVQSFTWFGKLRVFNPFKAFYTAFVSFWNAVKVRPVNVVPFCLFAKMLGAKILHIENLAQVENASVTGRLLYHIADHFFVQWEDLLKQYGGKAQFKGWVL